MTEPNFLAFPIIGLLISLSGFCFFYFWLWRPYRVDFARDRLFELRDELFDLARDGHISFDSPAYGMMRTAINGTIRHAHHIELLEFLGYIVVARRDPQWKTHVRGFEARWLEALASVSPEGVGKIQSIRFRLHMQVVDQLVFVSPVLLLPVIPALLWLVMVQVGGRTLRACRNIVGGSRVANLANQFDCTAMLIASDE